MPVQPPRGAFRPPYDAGTPQIVWRTLIADLETPVSAMLKLARRRPNSFLLESVEGGDTRGRYSIIGFAPDVIWRCRGDRAEINRQAHRDPDAFESEPPGALDSLRRLLAESRIELPDGLPPMAAGLVGFMGFDTVRLIERLPTDRPAALGLPDSLLIRPTVMAIFDAVSDTVTLATPVYPDPGVPADTADEVERMLEARLKRDGLGDWARAVVIEPELEAWVFAGSPHVAAVLGWESRSPDLQEALADQSLWPAGAAKPDDPKKAMEWVLARARIPRSSSIYRELAQKVSTQSCTDRAFRRLRGLLQDWFPPAG